MIRYGLLDDFDEVIRWVWVRPGPGYRYITQRVPRDRPARQLPDLSKIGRALF